MNPRSSAIFIGNSIFGDDRIGLLVGEALRQRLEDAGLDVFVVERTGFGLLDCLEGYGRAFVVDSFCADGRPEGGVFPFTIEDFRVVKSAAPHFSGVPEAVRLMGELGMETPDVSVIGIAVKDPYALADHLSKDLGRLTGAVSDNVYECIMAQREAGVSS